MTKDTRAKPSVPSAGAMRAVRAIQLNWTMALDNDSLNMALIIDRETGVGELLRAAKDALRYITIGDLESGTFSKETLEQAIAKCETGTGSE